MVALAFVVVGASSLVTPVEARKAVGAGPEAGAFASACGQGSNPSTGLSSDCRPPISTSPGP
jgi:hypothetical protein